MAAGRQLSRYSGADMNTNRNERTGVRLGRAIAWTFGGRRRAARGDALIESLRQQLGAEKVDETIERIERDLADHKGRTLEEAVRAIEGTRRRRRFRDLSADEKRINREWMEH